METFDKKYWDLNYAQPKTMDGIGNAKEHAQYLKSFFELEQVDISSVIDLGFGYGYLFQKVMKAFLPFKACGVEPSTYAFNKAKKRKLKPVYSTKLKLYNQSIQAWCKSKDDKDNQFDLGLCNSVFQYLDEKTLKEILPVMAKRIKYLYLTVPTDIELERQVDDLDFDDHYAIKRSRQFYRNLLSKNFTNISSKIWESKIYFNEKTTLFTDLLYRS